MTGPGTNTYLLGCTPGGGGEPTPRLATGSHAVRGSALDVAVVDPGPHDPGHLAAIVRAVAERGGTVRWVLVTHTHADHAPGAAALAASTGARIVGFGAREGFAPDVAAGDGWTLETPAFTLRALATSGHASDHLCYVVDLPAATGRGPLRVLLSGDHVMDRVTVVIAPPDGDMAAYLASLERLVHLDPPLDAIAPGHGRLLAEPGAVVRAVIEHRLAREALVARALGEAGTASVDDLVQAVYGDVDEALRPVARRSLWAHLRKLAAEGRAQELNGDGDGVPAYRIRPAPNQPPARAGGTRRGGPRPGTGAGEA